MGLKPRRDRLCLAQLSAGDNTAHLVQFDGKDWSAPRLKALLADPAVLKLFHFARFDMGVFAQHLGVMTGPVYCTKIASKLARTYTDRHGLKDLCARAASASSCRSSSKAPTGRRRSSPTSRSTTPPRDVLYLHALKAKLDAMLQREGRMAVAEACFRFLPIRVSLDLAGFEDDDIFAH